MSVKFKRIALRNWRQFKSISIDVHPRLTVITGSNGAGKTSILNLFSQHFGFARPFISTPRRNKEGRIVYDLGYYNKQSLTPEIGDASGQRDENSRLSPTLVDEDEIPERPPMEGAFVDIGEIVYGNEVQSQLGYPEKQSNVYGITIRNQQTVLGVQIGSHRTFSAYQPVEGLSLQAMAISQAYTTYFNEVTARMSGGRSQYSPIYRMKEALIAMAAFGEGNSYIEANAELLLAFNGFVDILQKVLPKELGFRSLVIRIPDIVLKTLSGDFTLDSSSGGVNAIIEITWQLYLFSLSNKEFVATIDEPENHLHPSMQRTILSNLIHAFPNVQFIVATHSPFIVSAVEDSFVYALKYFGMVEQSGFLPKGIRRVKSIRLDQTRKAGTASEILREVLGVNVTIPDWAQEKLDRIVDRYETLSIDASTLKSLRVDLTAAGFSEFYPQALSRLVKDL